MKYEEIVAKVKKAYAKADTALVDEHLAVQVDVTGEGEGAFYIEVADGKINVEPYEYHDHDFKIQCPAEEIIDIAEGKKKLGKEVEDGAVYVSRNVDKVAVFDLIVAKKSNAGRKKASDEKAVEEKAEKPAKEVKAKAEKKEKAEKKSAAKKESKKEAVKVDKKEEKKAEEVKAEAPVEKKRGGRKPKNADAVKAEEVKAEAPKTETPAPAAEPKKRGRKPKNAEAKA